MQRTTVLCGLLLSFSCSAADNVDLNVTGKLASGSCTPAIENNGVIDLGHLPVNNLAPEGAIGYSAPQYQHKKVAFDITCTIKVRLGFSVTDNQSGTVPPAFTNYHGAFGFGKTDQGQPIGLYQLYKNQVTIDGVSANLSYATGPNGSWGVAQALNEWPLYAFSAASDHTPTAGSQFHLLMDTTYYFEKSVVDGLNDALRFEGSATFSLIYL